MYLLSFARMLQNVASRCANNCPHSPRASQRILSNKHKPYSICNPPLYAKYFYLARAGATQTSALVSASFSTLP